MSTYQVEFISKAWWPETVNLGNEFNSSTDKHPSFASALAVCKLLREQGFGGEGKIFPTNTDAYATVNGVEVEIHGPDDEEVFNDRVRQYRDNNTVALKVSSEWGPKGCDNPTLQITWVTFKKDRIPILTS